MDIVTSNSRHFTASAVVIDPNAIFGARVLLIDHLAEGTRQFPGGHVDPDESPDEAAMREVFEETGVCAALVIPRDTPHRAYGRALPQPVMVTEFPAPAKPRKGEPAHRHIDFLYVATADSTLPLVSQPEENAGAVWLPINGVDPGTVRADVPGILEVALRWLVACE